MITTANPTHDALILPAVVIEGALADCCAGRGPDERTLRAAGLGQALPALTTSATEFRGGWPRVRDQTISSLSLLHGLKLRERAHLRQAGAADVARAVLQAARHTFSVSL